MSHLDQKQTREAIRRAVNVMGGQKGFSMLVPELQEALVMREAASCLFAQNSAVYKPGAELVREILLAFREVK
jgi:hypothetical protein